MESEKHQQQQQQQPQHQSPSPAAASAASAVSTPRKNDNDADDSPFMKLNQQINPSPATDKAALQLLQLHQDHAAAAAAPLSTTAPADGQDQHRRHGQRGAEYSSGRIFSSNSQPTIRPANVHNKSNSNHHKRRLAVAAFTDDYELDNLRRRVRVRRQVPPPTAAETQTIAIHAYNSSSSSFAEEVEGQFDDALLDHDTGHAAAAVAPAILPLPHHHHHHYPLSGHAHLCSQQQQQHQQGSTLAPWNSYHRHGRSVLQTQSPHPLPQPLPSSHPPPPPPLAQESPIATAAAGQQVYGVVVAVNPFGSTIAAASPRGSLLLLAPRPAGLSFSPRQQQGRGHLPFAGVGGVSSRSRQKTNRAISTTTNSKRAATARKGGRSASSSPLPPLTLPPVAVASSSSSLVAAAAATRKQQSLSNPSPPPPPPPPPAATTRTNSYGTKLFKNHAGGTFLDIFLNAPMAAAANSSISNSNAAVIDTIRQHPSYILIPDNGVDASLRLQQPTAAEELAANHAATAAAAAAGHSAERLIATPDIADTDILLGRGALTNRHVGNMAFRELVALYRPAYCTAQKYSKSQLARNLLLYLRLLGVRFLQKHEDGENNNKNTKKTADGGDSSMDEAACFWVECGTARAQAKVGQGLREGTSSMVRETLIKSMEAADETTKHQSSSTTTPRQQQEQDDDDNNDDYSTESEHQDDGEEEKKENEETFQNIENCGDGDDTSSSSPTTSSSERGDESGNSKKRKRGRRRHQKETLRDSSDGPSNATTKKKRANSQQQTNPIDDKTILQTYDI